MLSFKGYWLESIYQLDRELVSREEGPDHVDGIVPIRYDEINLKKLAYKMTIDTTKIEMVIEVETRVSIRPKDRVWVSGKWYKVDSVESFVPENKKHILKMFPNRRQYIERKLVILK